jgi:hypothetical protein
MSHPQKPIRRCAHAATGDQRTKRLREAHGEHAALYYAIQGSSGYVLGLLVYATLLVG